MENGFTAKQVKAFESEMMSFARARIADWQDVLHLENLKCGRAEKLQKLFDRVDEALGKAGAAQSWAESIVNDMR